jgi:hypothetical protein
MGGGSIGRSAGRNTGGSGLGVLVPTKHPIMNPNQNVAAITQGHPWVAGRTPRRSSIASLGASLAKAPGPLPPVPLRFQSTCFRCEQCRTVPRSSSPEWSDEPFPADAKSPDEGEGRLPSSVGAPIAARWQHKATFWPAKTRRLGRKSRDGAPRAGFGGGPCLRQDKFPHFTCRNVGPLTGCSARRLRRRTGCRHRLGGWPKYKGYYRCPEWNSAEPRSR